jgi:hypothetical protein
MLKKINAERNSRKVVDMEVEVKCLRARPQTRWEHQVRKYVTQKKGRM